MEVVYKYFKVQLPAYLKSIPLPKTFDGFLALNREEWLELLPLLIMVSVLVYLTVSPIFGLCFSKKEKRPHVNMKIKKDEEKVATEYKTEDLGDKKVFCRCWKSNKFPLCDGSHNQHNRDTGDNVGPLIIKSTKAEGEKTKKEDKPKKKPAKEE